MLNFFKKPKGGVKPIRAELPTTTINRGTLEPHSPTWVYIEDWANIRLAEVRQANDSQLLDATKTAILRGKIKTLKEILALPDDTARGGILNITNEPGSRLT